MKILKEICPSWLASILRKIIILLKRPLYKSNKLTESITFVKGGVINLHKGSFVDDKLRLTGNFELNITRIMRSIVNSGNVCVDIGANIGLHTVLLSKLVGSKGFVYAFEPVPYNIKKLNTNLILSGCDNVKIISKAVADSNGEMAMNIVSEDNFDQGSSSLVMNEFLSQEGSLTKQYKVNVVKLETFVEINKLENIDFIKMDIEGFEYWALKGFGNKILSQMKPKMIIEYNTNRMEFLGVYNSDFQNLLEEIYDCYEICKQDMVDQSFSLEPFYFDRTVATDLLCIPKYEKEK